VNLFIAECKFWAGPSRFEDAIDQLLGNLTGDDRHAAMLVFSDRERSVVDKVQDTIKGHEAFDSELSRFQNYDIYRFRESSDGGTKIASIVVDLGP
jgi:hypothetical protein